MLLERDSEKEGAAATFKRGSALIHEALAGLVRPGNAHADTAADHIALVAGCWSSDVVIDSEIVECTDSAADAHACTDDLADANLRLLRATT